MKTFKLIWLVLAVTTTGCAREQPPVKVTENDWVNTKSGLVYRVIAKGTGPNAITGQRVTIHEALTLPDGKLIFSSRAKNQPVTFTLGANQVIPGVEEGVTGMTVGERRTLRVPPALDGRQFDPAFIPPEAIRHYEIELLAILP
jgi:FKBP-type peptidyl-prolyl cis-trans isomerase